MNSRHGHLLRRLGAGLAVLVGLAAVRPTVAPARPGNPAGGAPDDSTMLMSAAEARAAAGRMGAAMGLAGAIDPTRYLLGPGDALSLEFSGRIYRQLLLAVDAEGRVNVPEIGVISAGGLTLSEVRSRVLGRLRSLYTGVRVDLRLIRLRDFKVYVTGEVAAPGPVLANAATRVSEVFHDDFALAERASHRNIELRHRDGRVERADLDLFSRLGDDSHNPLLQDGDVITVPVRKFHAFAFGAFGRPGEFELAPGDSVHLLVRLAEGLLAGADPNSGLLYRFTSPTQVDSMPVPLDTGAGPGDVALQDGDRLFARAFSDYRVVRNVTLVGEFVYPGPYSIREGLDRIGDVVRRAGGLTPLAARNRIRVYRPPSAVSDRTDTEFERLARLSRNEMTEAEYQTFKTKLASREASFVLAFNDLGPGPNPLNVLLRDGDVIAVDRETPAVRVDGQVLEPSLIEYVPGRTVDDYVRLAGGLGARAWVSKIRITRAGLNRTLYARDAGLPQPGDFIWVPEKNETSFWGVFKDVLTVAGAAATVVIVVRGH